MMKVTYECIHNVQFMWMQECTYIVYILYRDAGDGVHIILDGLMPDVNSSQSINKSKYILS